MTNGISKSTLKGSARARMLVRRALELQETPPVPVRTPDKPISTAGNPPAMKRRTAHAVRLFQ